MTCITNYIIVSICSYILHTQVVSKLLEQLQRTFEAASYSLKKKSHTQQSACHVVDIW